VDGGREGISINEFILIYDDENGRWWSVTVPV
jgi:hypothetical protein